MCYADPTQPTDEAIASYFTPLTSSPRRKALVQDRTFGNSRGVRRLERSKLFWPEERPDVIAEEARRLWEPRPIG